MTEQQTTFYDAVGGAPTFERLVAAFYRGVAQDLGPCDVRPGRGQSEVIDLRAQLELLRPAGGQLFGQLVLGTRDGQAHPLPGSGQHLGDLVPVEQGGRRHAQLH